MAVFNVADNYEPVRKGDIGLTTGDQVDHIKDLGHGWLIGRNVNTRQTGSFPASCIDRETTVSGAILRRLTRRTRSVRPTKGPKVTLLEGKIDGVQLGREEASGSSSVPDGTEDDAVECISQTENKDVNGETSKDLGGEDLPESSNESSLTSCRRHFLWIIFRLIGAIAMAGAFFSLLYYGFKLDIPKAGYPVIAPFGLFIFLFTFSLFFRCVILVMIPNLLTGKGRTILLSVITGLLVTGPGMNISHNIEEVSGSLGCTTDLIYNQTRALRKQLEEPIRALAQQLMNFMRSLKDIVNTIKDALKPITDVLRQFADAIEASLGKITEISVKCERDLQKAETKCKDAMTSIKSRCVESINKYDPSNKIKKGVSTAIDKIKDIGSWGRRRKRAGEVNGSQTLQSHVKRRSLSSVCKIFDVGSGVCNVMKGVSLACKPFSFLKNIMKGVTDKMIKGLRRVENFFEFSIVRDFDISGSADSSKDAATVLEEIKADIQSKVQIIGYFIKYLNYTLSLSLLVLFIKSLYFVRKYRSKCEYDNKYITPAFVAYDEECTQQGEEPVLPLKEREVTEYMISSSIKPSFKEMSKIGGALITLTYHIIITSLIVGFDYILYYVLGLVQKYGNVALTVEGANTIDVEIDGNGIISMILRKMIADVNVDSTYSVNFNFTSCLPNARKPDFSYIPIFSALYGVAFTFLIMQAYGLRLRRTIASHCYPGQERNRIVYLREKILQDRLKFRAWMKDLTFRRRKEKEVTERTNIRGMVSYRLPLLACVCKCLLPDKRSCNCCDVLARRGMLFVRCTNYRCKAIFCNDCMEIMKGRCFVCEVKQEIFVSVHSD